MDSRFLQLIESHSSFLLCGHEHPDGDCLGAQAALYHLLRAQGKEVRILNPDPVPAAHAALTAHTPYGVARGETDLSDISLVVLLDCAQLSRLADLGQCIRRAGLPLAVIDHHVGSEDGDGQVCYVDSTAASTGTLVHRLYEHYRVQLSQAAAEGVFVSLVADTGWFRYSNTDAETLSIAAELVRAGVEPARIYDAMHRQMHTGSVELLQRALATHRVELGGRYAYAMMDKAAMARAAEISFETDGVLEPLRCIGGIEVVALLKERFDGAVKLSLRASGAVDVRAIAAEFGGGGHVKAAGAVLDGPLSKAAEVLSERVAQALQCAGIDAGGR